MTKTLVKEGVDYYDYLMSLGDERVENWGLMYSPVPTILITTAYLLSKSDNRKIDKSNAIFCDSVSIRPSPDGPLQAPEPPASGCCLQPRLRRPQPLHRAGDLHNLSPDRLQLDMSTGGLQLGPLLSEDSPSPLVVLHQQTSRALW